MKKKKRLLLPLLLLFIMCFSSISYANSTQQQEAVDATCAFPDNLTIVVQIAKQANVYAGNKTILTWNQGILTFDNSAYYELDTEEKKDFMEQTLSYIKEANMGATQKNKLYNFIASQDESVSASVKYLKSDVSADFVEARKWFQPFSGPISTFMGFMCICIFAFLGLSVAFDVMYLVIPPFQMLVEGGEDNKRPWGVSIEAWNTKKEMEKPGNEGKQSMQLYLRKRIPVFIICALTLGWLISGQIYDFVAWILDNFSFN